MQKTARKNKKKKNKLKLLTNFIIRTNKEEIKIGIAMNILLTYITYCY